MDYFLEDGNKFADDFLLERGGKAAPDGVRWDGHKISLCCTSVTNSVTLSKVSLVPRFCRGRASWVADSGMRMRIAIGLVRIESWSMRIWP